MVESTAVSEYEPTEVASSGAWTGGAPGRFAWLYCGIPGVAILRNAAQAFVTASALMRDVLPPIPSTPTASYAFEVSRRRYISAREAWERTLSVLRAAEAARARWDAEEARRSLMLEGD